MRVARCHPLLGWLRLDGHTYSRTLDQSLCERDRALEHDRNHSGHAEGFVDWVWTTQLPELVRKGHYVKRPFRHLDDKLTTNGLYGVVLCCRQLRKGIGSTASQHWLFSTTTRHD